MKKIAFFCIPAHGHTNPMLPVAAELVKRGNRVRFYSFSDFEDKIRATGAEFVSCEAYLPKLSEEEEKNIKNVSNTEMTIQDIRVTLAMNDFLEKEFADFKPDVVYTDSVCFWGKLNAWKHEVPMVCSTSTFAFNEMSSKYMGFSAGEMKDMIFGLSKISAEVKKLNAYGYKVRKTLDLVQNDNKTDTIVYTSRAFQPYSESFSDHYNFVGPSVFSKAQPQKDKARPLVYISMGTVINDRPDFYNKCIEALGGMDIDVIISRGKFMDEAKLGRLPDNIKTYPSVDQLDVLSKADAFITHCGMNSVSESLYMATPMALYPQTSEQGAVAKRVAEMNAGIMLRGDSAAGIKAVITRLLTDKKYAAGAKSCCDDFRSCAGVQGAAEFIENAPHTSGGVDLPEEMKKVNGPIQLCYWAVAAALLVLFGIYVSWNYAWIIGIAAGVLNYPVTSKIKMQVYHAKAKKLRAQREKQ